MFQINPQLSARIILIFSFLLLLFFKLPLLDLPHHWDEAFPYSYCISFMSEAGPGLLSDSAPTELTRGHPLLYHFLQASWNNLMDGRMWLERLLPLLFSLAILLFTYSIGKMFFDELTGAMASLLLVCQDTFIAQATFQLSETLLTLLMLLSTITLYKRKWILFIVFSSLLLLVKESGMVLLALLFAWDFLFLRRNLPVKSRIPEIKYFLIPLVVGLSFYLHQYFVQGWFFYPLHTTLIETNFSVVLDQAARYFSHLFLYSGRNIIFFSVLLILIIRILIKKVGRVSIRIEGIIFLVILVVGYLLFSSFNFYSNRYLLCIFPLFTLGAAVGLRFALQKNIALVSAFILGAVSIYAGYDRASFHDHSVGYARAIEVQQETTNWILANVPDSAAIQTNYLMRYYLESEAPGYVSKAQKFTNVQNTPLISAGYIVSCANEPVFLPDDSGVQIIEVFRAESDVQECRVFFVQPN